MRRLIIAIALTVVPLAPAPATLPALEIPAPASLDWFHGEWRGEVNFLGNPATGHLTVQPGLNGSATVSNFTADVPAAGDRPALRFEGQGIYWVRPDGRVTGQWADSFENSHQLRGRADHRELRVTWGDARSEVGHSSYVLSADGVLTVTDSVFTQGQVRVFNQGTYRRAP